MPKVWVGNLGGHDVSGAGKFGEVIILTRGTIPIFNTERLWFQIRKRLADASGDDYILLTGPQILSSLLVAYFMYRFGKANVLLYNAKTGSYVPRTLVADHLFGTNVLRWWNDWVKGNEKVTNG